METYPSYGAAGPVPYETFDTYDEFAHDIPPPPGSENT
jgi:hypothetical protein